MNEGIKIAKSPRNVCVKLITEMQIVYITSFERTVNKIAYSRCFELKIKEEQV